MSADNYYFIRCAHGKFAACMGFESDERWPTVQKSDPRFDTPQEAIAWASKEYTEYGVKLHPSVETIMRNMDPVTPLKREIRTLRGNLKHLTKNVAAFLDLLDAEMKQQSTFERGRRIAKLMNGLEMTNDTARMFGLKEKNLKKSKRKEAANV